jgi:uncharacterized membrane protein
LVAVAAAALRIFELAAEATAEEVRSAKKKLQKADIKRPI